MTKRLDAGITVHSCIQVHNPFHPPLTLLMNPDCQDVPVRVHAKPPSSTTTTTSDVYRPRRRESSGQIDMQLQSTLKRLPTEVRLLIYDFLLQSPVPIHRPHLHLSSYTGLPDYVLRPVKGIDARLLRTCKLFHCEGMPILYRNQFVFDGPCQIAEFFGEHDRERLGCWRTQRLTSVKLVIGRQLEMRDRYRNYWTESIFSYRKTARQIACPLLSRNGAANYFRSLRELELDFTVWNLTEEGAFPPLLLLGIVRAGLKADVVRIVGLEKQPVVENLLEQALLKESSGKKSPHTDCRLLHNRRAERPREDEMLL